MDSMFLHQLFEEQAEKTPHFPAVWVDNHEITYQELNRRANRLAATLQKIGIKPDSIVGICMERSIEMAIAIYGVLKSGGAYLPLDPSYPTERLAYMLQDSGARVLLVDHSVNVDFSKVNVEILNLDHALGMNDQEVYSNVDMNGNPNHLAYLIYTSGSTGRPKGVMVPHSAICNQMLWMKTTFNFSIDDRIVQRAPFGFDASIWEFHLPLISGGQLILAKPGGHRDARYLVELIRAKQITYLQLVPSLLKILLGTNQLGLCTSLKSVFCGGEVLPTDIRDRVMDILPADLYNLYGPTETTINTTYYHCRKGESYRTVPIGKPISNVEVYILDQNRLPVPEGVEGELYIGGRGLSRGYIHQQKLTAECFIKNPFNDQPEDKLYKTGDFVRSLPDGNLEFIGRIDEQVKINGNRIELEEIEVALREFYSIREAVVKVWPDSSGLACLVAYLICKEGMDCDIREIRDFVKAKLPLHMIPQFFQILEDMPLTPSGKIDKKGLPEPDLSLASAQNDLFSSENPIERIIASIWEQVLHIPGIGNQSNFFDIGGNSLKLLQVHNLMCEKLPIAVPVIDLFKYPTIYAQSLLFGVGQTARPNPASGGEAEFDTHEIFII